MGSGGVIGYEIGKGLGYWEGKQAGIAQEAAKIDAQGQSQAQEAEAARQPALAPGAFLRLRQSWCSDCLEARDAH
jgi:hypothetical protein